MMGNRIRSLPFPGVDPLAIPAGVFVLLLIAAGSASSTTYLTPTNAGNVLIQITPLLIVAIGQTLVISSAGIDLSVGSVVSLASVVFASLFAQLGLPLAIAAALAACLSAGIANGLLVSRGLDPFLATLATLSIVQGVAFTILEVPGGSVPAELGALSGFMGGAVPVALPLLVGFVGLAAVLLRGTKVGLDILSTGSNSAVARLLGVPVSRARLIAYGLSALFAGLAGIFLTSRTLSGDPLAGTSFTLDSIAAVVLGGTALTGGRATILGTCLGALAIGLLSNVMNYAQISTYYQTGFKGALVIVAVVAPHVAVQILDRLRDVRATRRILGAASEEAA